MLHPELDMFGFKRSSSRRQTTTNRSMKIGDGTIERLADDFASKVNRQFFPCVALQICKNGIHGIHVSPVWVRCVSSYQNLVSSSRRQTTTNRSMKIGDGTIERLADDFASKVPDQCLNRQFFPCVALQICKNGIHGIHVSPVWVRCVSSKHGL
jgi:hypothetical protein